MARPEQYASRKGLTSVASTKREELEAWLNGKPPEWATIIALRAALRVVPLLGIAISANGEIESTNRGIILPTFYRLHKSWVASAWSVPGPGTYAEEYYSSRDPNVAQLAADAAVDASNSFVKSTEPASFAANAVIFAMRAAGASHADNIWDYVWVDAQRLESKLPSDLAIRALWPNEIPPWMNHYWAAFKRALLDVHDDWDVWVNWYDARLTGANAESINKDIEIARANIPKTILSQSPRAVNAYIRQIVDRHSSKELPSEPPEGPGPRFTPTPSGFEIVPSVATHVERENPTQISLHRQLNRRVERLALVVHRIQNTHKGTSNNDVFRAARTADAA